MLGLETSVNHVLGLLAIRSELVWFYCRADEIN